MGTSSIGHERDATDFRRGSSLSGKPTQRFFCCIASGWIMSRNFVAVCGRGEFVVCRTE
jgi:hypothetical protein